MPIAPRSDKYRQGIHQKTGIQMPRWMQVDFSPHIQAFAEKSESEVGSEAIQNIFVDTYLKPQDAAVIGGYQLNREGSVDTLQAELKSNNAVVEIDGKGKGVLDAFVRGLSSKIGRDIVLLDYSEHALPSKKGAENQQAEAMAYVQISINGSRYCAAALCDDIVTASMQAVLNALGRSTVNL